MIFVPFFYSLMIFQVLTFGCQDDSSIGTSLFGHNDPPAQPESPNIIFLLTDDQRYDALSYAGNKVLQTPNMDWLATHGVYFKNAYVTTSICAMSRASILTGQYARRHDIWDFGESLTEAQFAKTYPALLKQAGYTTGFIGKFGVGRITQPFIDQYFDYWQGFNGQGSYNANYKGTPLHLTEKIGIQALEFLDKKTASNKPFCLSISFKAPHVEGDPGYFLPDPAFADLYKSDVIEEPRAAAEKYRNYFPANFIKNENGAGNVARNRWVDRFSTPNKFQINVKKYYQLIHGTDVVVGKILEKLKTTGLDKNTVIIFSSDNGFYLGEYGFAGKWYGSEPSIRVPLIIYDPRLTTSQVIEEMVLNIDIAPTILSMAGVDIPAVVQGEDLVSIIKGNPANWRQEFLYEHLWNSSDAYFIPSTEGVVTKDYKYMNYFIDRDYNNSIFEELYDRHLDKSELHNRIDESGLETIRSELMHKLVLLKAAAQ